MPVSARTLRVVASSFLIALGAGGCHGPEPAKFNRGLGASQDPSLIVPFSERVKNRLYGESARGTIVAEELKNWARAEWAVDFDESESVLEVFDKVRDRDTTDELTTREWQELTVGLGVRYVVTGDIKKFDLLDPRMVGLVAPKATVSFRVIDVKDGRTVFADRGKDVSWERVEEHAVPMAFVGQDLAGVERKLLERIAEEVGKDLYGYMPR